MIVACPYSSHIIPSCSVSIISIPFLIIVSLPDIIALIIVYPFGEETVKKYKEWRKNLKEYWHDTCLDIVDCVFDTEREETLPYIITDVSNNEINEFFSNEYETIEYPHEEIEICSVCMYKLNTTNDDEENYIKENNPENEDKSVLLTCGHCFHEECLKSWYKSSLQQDCPICRKTMEIKNYYVFNDIKL